MDQTQSGSKSGTEINAQQPALTLMQEMGHDFYAPPPRFQLKERRRSRIERKKRMNR